MADKNYKKALEYFKTHMDKVKKGFVNIPYSELGLPSEKGKILGYEFK